MLFELFSRNIIIGLYYAYNKTHYKDLGKLKNNFNAYDQKETTIKFNKFFREAHLLFLLEIL